MKNSQRTKSCTTRERPSCSQFNIDLLWGRCKRKDPQRTESCTTYMSPTLNSGLQRGSKSCPCSRVVLLKWCRILSVDRPKTGCEGRSERPPTDPIGKRDQGRPKGSSRIPKVHSNPQFTVSFGLSKLLVVTTRCQRYQFKFHPPSQFCVRGQFSLAAIPGPGPVSIEEINTKKWWC